MNKRQVIVLWAIAAALAGAAVFVKSGQNQSRQSVTKRAAGQTLFESFPAADISSIEIKGATSSADLVKKDGKWTVAERDSYPANSATINELLRTLGELKVTQGIEAGPSFAPRFGIDEASSNSADRGVTATFKDASGKELAKVSIGKNIESAGASASPFGGGAAGRFLRNHADESGFYATSEMFHSVSDDPKRWLADGFIQVEKIKSISITEPGKADEAWKLSRLDESMDFKLDSAMDAELDPATTGPLKSLFSFTRFDDVLPAAKFAERADESQKRVATINTFDNFTYTINIVPAKPEAAPATPNPEEPAPAADNFILTVDVKADIAKERVKAPDEKEEDAKTQDTAFTERQKSLADKLAKEQAFAGRAFEVTKFTVDALLKTRPDLFKKSTPPPSPHGQLMPMEGGSAVTPPFSIPPTITPIPAE